MEVRPHALHPCSDGHLSLHPCVARFSDFGFNNGDFLGVAQRVCIARELRIQGLFGKAFLKLIAFKFDRVEESTQVHSVKRFA